jgi:RNA polymerase sigma-70 factor (ECF subfamily)
MPPAKPTPSNEIALLQALMDPARRAAAFPLLLDRYQDRLHAHLLRLLGDADDAADCVQETFIKVWHKLDAFEGRSKLYTWIYRIATNEALSLLRARRRKPTHSLDDPDTTLPEPVAVQELDGEAIQQALQRALEELPERQRQVFVLRYQEEMPYAEMAELLDLSTGALKASYHHAVRKVEQSLRLAMSATGHLPDP